MKTCTTCHTENRDTARFCKHCGKVLDLLQGLIAKDNLRPQLEKFRRSCASRHRLQEKLGKDAARTIGLDCLITGDAGTGKNHIAKLLRDIAVTENVIKQYDIASYDASDIESLTKNLDNILSSHSNGILLITNAHKLVSADAGNAYTPLDGLFRKMATEKNMPIIFLSGLRSGMESFVKGSPDIISRFEFAFTLESFSDTDLTALTCSILSEMKIGISSQAQDKLSAHFRHVCRHRDESFENAHIAVKKAQELYVNMDTRGGNTIEESDVQGELFVRKTEAEIFASLDSFVGLHEVKSAIRTIVEDIKDEKRTKGKDARIRLTDHFVFSGNPGTGKTTVARLFADMLNTLEVLPSGQLVEVEGKDLVSQYVGGTAPKVKEAVAKAMGGVLFIDEAYTLSDNDNGGYGKEAIETLLPLLENRKGEFVCIIAGYTRQMNDFLHTNPGLPRRFNKTIHFADYTPSELQVIFMNCAEKYGLSFSEDALSRLPDYFERLYLSRTEGFGNAGEVKNRFNETLSRLRQRRNKMNDSQLKTQGHIIEWPDIVGNDEAKDLSVDDVIRKLDRFVGMYAVKGAMRELANKVAYSRKRMEAGVGVTSLPAINIILTGNPGTGKTSVARVLGELFKAMGLTATDRVVEKSYSDIVGKYVNEADKNMDNAINEAIGGVLFIDEAYNLADGNEWGNGVNQEGKKAIERLMVRMENDRGKFVLICAGYKDKMERFLKVNDGLKRRFNYNIHIDDYTADELLLIYEQELKNKYYTFADNEAKKKALSMFEMLCASKDGSFGNAGLARNLAEQTETAIANRIQKQGYKDKSDFTLVRCEDIPCNTD